jgi:ATP-dependent RNA helicase UAP56/SUB2
MEIMEILPRDKQVMMFSATLSDRMRTFCKMFTQNPLEVIIGDDTKLTLHGLQQYYVELQENEKSRKLFNLLTTVEFKQAIIFVNTIQRCIALTDILNSLKFSVTNIHSSMTQEMRLYSYQLIKNYKKRILITTKMFDRGIDFERVNLVINYDMPDNSDTYLHCVGRAGRFGTKGIAVTFVCGHVDSIIYKEVQSRFDIKLSELPETIDISSNKEV